MAARRYAQRIDADAQEVAARAGSIPRLEVAWASASGTEEKFTTAMSG
jgi:hypothetical protein